MKIAYVIPAFLPRSSSIGKKVSRAVASWSALGVEVRLFIGAVPRDPWDVAAVEMTAPWTPHPEMRRQWLAARMARRVEAWHPDLVYTRIMPWMPGLDGLARRRPFVHEVNTDDRTEFPMWSRATGALHGRTRHRTLRHVDGFVFLTAELQRSASYAAYDRPSIVIGNGIPLGEVEVLAAPRNDRPRVAFLAGSPSAWQGIDKVVRLAALLPDVEVDIAGWTDLQTAGLPPNVTVHGDLRGGDLRALLTRCDAALGTLALHRKGMSEACPLKVREYLAYGIPVVIAYDDPDLEALGPEHVLRIPNTEDNVERGAAEVLAFARASVGRRVPRSLIGHLDHEALERRRLSFLGRVAGRDA